MYKKYTNVFLKHALTGNFLNAKKMTKYIITVNFRYRAQLGKIK